MRAKSTIRRQTGSSDGELAPSGIGLATIIALAALLVAAAAGVLALTRPASSDPATCRSTAWDAVPAAAALPAGWSLTGTGLDADGYSSALVGPVPSGASSQPESVFLKVTCFGSDSHQAVTRSHTMSLAGGATDVAFARIGDESYATRSSDGSTSLFVRRGSLVATLGASSGVDPSVLQQAAGALASAMETAEASGSGSTAAANAPSPPPSGSAGSSGAASPPVSGSVAPESPSATPSHLAPDLEAMLPHKVNGTTLESQSTDGTKGLGEDPSSRSLIASLATLGRRAADLQIADAYDPSGTLDLNLIAFRASGVSGATLRQEVLKSWLAGAASGLATTTVTLGGKQVIRLDYGDGGTRDYLYAHGAIVIDVATSDEKLAGQVLGSLA